MHLLLLYMNYFYLKTFKRLRSKAEDSLQGVVLDVSAAFK